MIRGARAAAVLLAGGLALAGLAPAAQAAPAAPTISRFLIRTAGAVPSRARLEARAPAADVVAVRPLAHRLAVVSAEGDPVRAARALARVPGVQSVSVDDRMQLAGTPAPVKAGDVFDARQWDLWDAVSNVRAGGFGVDAPRAWTTTEGSSSVVVAVLDTGITAHPDLVGATFVPGYDFVSGADGVLTGDGDGWDADPTDPGDVCTAADEDSSWHGTFVTSEIVAQHGTTGVAGEAPGVSLEPVRVLGGCGGTESDTIAAIEWASGGTVPGVPANAQPANVISMSLATESGSCSPALQTAITDAVSRGTVVVAAAGNESHAVSIDSPADCAGVISVAATTRSGSLADYSNYGTSAMSPTISAPGGSESDPVLGDTWTSTGAFTAKGNEAAVGGEIGTSMAAPRVSASIALLLSVEPGLTPAQITQRLTDTATPFPSGSSCTVVRCGAGIVNAGNLVGAAQLFVHASAVRVTGTARVGATLRAQAGRWRPDYNAITYRWTRDGKRIAGATRPTLKLRARDAGHRIVVVVTVVRADTDSATASSKPVRVTR